MRWTQRSRGGDSTCAVARWMFLRALGAIYLIAFVSLWTQILGLVGHKGILPASEFLHAVAKQVGPERFWLAPTLCWWNSSDRFLQLLCGCGVVSSVLLIFDVAPALTLGLLWASYLSLVTVCREFLSFQWDNLLLEAGCLAVFLAPLRWWRSAGRDAPPSMAVVWLLRWLLFRLLFSSGVVKLMSGDSTWRALTALTYHYETQPLPTWTSWYMHQLPAWFHRVSCGFVFIEELVVPVCIFGSRRVRHWACAMSVVFQLLIIATGNYCFFNLLTIALCLVLLDDAGWPSRWRQVLARHEAQPTRSRRWPAWVIAPVAATALLVTGLQTSEQFGFRSVPTPLLALQQLVEPLRTFNTYGLFAVMTIERPEIIVEGSRDGLTWQAYEFRYKPGDPTTRPPFVAPHQPRLDWQMWFAALSDYRHNPWLLQFCGRLLQGSPDVSRLLSINPFGTIPPRYIRAVVYEYHFTNPTTRRAKSTWWRRERKGLYCPVLSLSRH